MNVGMRAQPYQKNHQLVQDYVMLQDGISVINANSSAYTANLVGTQLWKIRLIYMKIAMPQCLICENEYQPFIDFGDMPIANAFASREEAVNEYTFPMQVGFCEHCKMVQLVEQPDRERMFHENYAFFSSTSSYMKEHFKRFANSVSELQGLNRNSLVVEIGSNDGILLQNFVLRTTMFGS